MKTVPEPPGNSFEPLGKPIRPEAKPAPTAPTKTDNPRISKRVDGMLETMIPGNEGKVPKSDFLVYLRELRGTYGDRITTELP